MLDGIANIKKGGEVMNETFLTGLEISGAVGPDVGIPTFLLTDIIAKLWTAKEIASYPSA